MKRWHLFSRSSFPGATWERDKTASNRITLTEMDDPMIAKVTGPSVEEVAKLRAATWH